MTWLSCMICASGVPLGCIRKSSVTPSTTQKPNTVPPTKTADAAPYPVQFGLTGVTPLNERNPLGTRLTDASLHDLYVALTACECLPKLQMRLITSLNADRGALPQALTPAVRREILNNPQLKILNSVPRPLDDIVGGIFADEQKISEEVSKGLFEKIKPAESAWAAQSDLPVLQLDAFPPLPATRPPAAGRSVRLIDVFVRWGLLTSHGGPWSSERAGSKDAGLLWHEFLRGLAEAEYLYGLAGSESGNSWGGLTLPVDLQINNPGPFDPRTAYNQVRFLSGQLNLKLSSNVSLTLARYGGERWTWFPAPIQLAEQAVQWWVSARLLNRTRPLNRGPFTTYFPALIPDDSYQLSLLILPALDALLSGRFIDENTRIIRSYISGEQVGGVAYSVREKADPQSLSLLLLALSSWTRELKSVSDLNVSSETAKQLKNAPKSLQRGAQLIVQTILGELIAPRSTVPSDTTGQSYSLYLNPVDRAQGELPLRDHAQVLHALVSVESTMMPSIYLRGRITQLATGLAQRWRELAPSDPAKEPITPLIWMKSACDLFAEKYPETEITTELKAISADIANKLRTIEESVLQ